MSDNEHEDPPGVDAGVVQQPPVEQQEILQFAHRKFSGISSGQIFIQAGRVAEMDSNIRKISQGNRSWQTKWREPS